MFIKTFNKQFGSQALTLSPSDLGFNPTTGWTITGAIIEDYYKWVNNFEARHPALGVVMGNFEVEVTADSEYAFDDFMSHYSVRVWDYQDI